MFDGLYDIDWSSMEHAYGSAGEIPELMLALRSADRRERHQALEQYYSAVHHQGGVYPCTTASLPFLFELAGDPATLIGPRSSDFWSASARWPWRKPSRSTPTWSTSPAPRR
ncbi:hypothetical protein ACFQ0B_79445 [Nonomuraea thailandensis]